MRILIVDDSRVMRSLVVRALKAAGHVDLAEANSGLEALEALRASPFDFVLSDWNMPQMDGMGLLQALRAAGSSVPVAFITSECTTAMIETALAAGVCFVLNKPFTSEALGQALATATGAKAA